MKDADLVQKAKQFATQAHASINHRRKYTYEPYIHHPEAVVALVSTVAHSDEMLAAAWLHDTVEDTPVTLEEITRQFGSLVSRYVEMLTDVSVRNQGGRVERKNQDLRHSALACAEAQTIKLADLIDNAKSIVACDPTFALSYLAEKHRLLRVLTLGDPLLRQYASQQLAAGLNNLIALHRCTQQQFEQKLQEYDADYPLG